MRRRQRQTRSTSKLEWLNQPFKQPRNPLPPLAWVDEAAITTLHNASMDILENIGLDFLDEEAMDIWQAAGAKVDRASQHVWLDRGLVMEAVAQAPATFTWHARNPDYNLHIGGNALTFMPNSGMPYVTSLDNGRRTSTLTDLENFTKLAHISPIMHFGGGTHCEPQDIPASLRHLHRMRAMLTLTDKAVRDVAHSRIIPADNVEMARIAFGGTLPDGPVLGGTINVNSPLIYDGRMLGGLISFAKLGQVSVITPFIMAGAMSPVTMASALAQQNAEALAGVALAQLVRPGAPVVYGGFTMNVDMKSGSPAFGSPEGAWATVVGGQMARHYGLPYRSSGSLTNSKLPDAQAAYETMWTMWPAVMSHTNMMMHGVGWLEAGLVASYEKFILDLESLAMFAHWLNGFTIDAESLALDMIAEVGPGGHHFGTPHTQDRFRTAFYQPFVMDRQGYEPWLAQGGLDAAQRANKIWKQLLREYEEPEMETAVLEELNDFVTRRERELAGVDLYA